MGDVLVNGRENPVQKINAALEEMAKRLEPGCPEKDCPWIVFLLEQTKYAINAMHVLRVAVLSEIIPVKDAPEYCPGIVWSRDGIIRLLDLRVLFGLENFHSSVIRAEDHLPVIIVDEPDGKKHGIIVDKLLLMEHFQDITRDFACEDPARAQFLCGAITDERYADPVFVIQPNRFCDFETKPSDAEIDWNARIDIKLLAEKLRRDGSL